MAHGEARTRKHQLQRLLTQGTDGVVCHPRLVQTGLNLTQFPTIVFFQFDYTTWKVSRATKRVRGDSSRHEDFCHLLT